MGASREIAPKLDFRTSKAQKNENLLISETSEIARRAPLGVIFEESAFIEHWRVSVQFYKESIGQMSMQEDMKTAFEKLIDPVKEHNWF